jgi:organic hydroperoxide reductase OsmC/OhrA
VIVESKVFSYRAELAWTGGRAAAVTAGERPALVVAPPPDFPAGDDSQWSPEHLFLASIQSCTMLSFIAHAAHAGVELVGYESHAVGRLARRESDRRYAFEVVEMVVMARVAGGHVEAARGLTSKAERDCFISASTTAEVRTDWRIIE